MPISIQSMLKRTTLRPDGDLSALVASRGLTSRIRFKEPLKIVKFVLMCNVKLKI